jgi:hypothetical protein
VLSSSNVLLLSHVSKSVSKASPLNHSCTSIISSINSVHSLSPIGKTHSRYQGEIVVLSEIYQYDHVHRIKANHSLLDKDTISCLENSIASIIHVAYKILSVNHVVSDNDNHAHVILVDTTMPDKLSQTIMLEDVGSNINLLNCVDLNQENCNEPENNVSHTLVISTRSSFQSNQTSVMRRSYHHVESG